MVQSLEAIKGGGGSIRIGSRGTISSLVTRELESMKVTPELPPSARTRRRAQKIPVDVNCGTATVIKLQQRKSMDKPSSSHGSNHVNTRTSETFMKTKACPRTTHKMPMLGADNIHLDRALSREKMVGKGIHIVDIVDVNCGTPNRAWVNNPITNRLKKLGFSKLSETIA